jgi:tetratricopeptide (TPR) repeat protein
MARAGEHTEAESLLIEAREATSVPDAEIEEALAKIYIETFRFGPALQAIDRWIAAAPRDPKPYLWRTEINIRRRAEFSAVIDDFQKALERDATSAKARLGLADALRNANRLTEAAKEYEAYLAIRPTDPEAHVGAARTALALSREDEAIRHFDLALKAAPDDVAALTGRAGISLSRNDAAGALVLLDRGLKLYPHDPELRYRRALVLTRLGRNDEAKSEHEAAKELRADQAELSRIRRALIQTPNNAKLQTEAAKWLLAHGHEDEGLEWANRVLRAHPDHVEIHRALAAYYTRIGNVKRANFHKIQSDRAG